MNGDAISNYLAFYQTWIELFFKILNLYRAKKFFRDPRPPEDLAGTLRSVCFTLDNVQTFGQVNSSGLNWDQNFENARDEKSLKACIWFAVKL